MNEDEFRKTPPRPYFPSMLMAATILCAVVFGISEGFWQLYTDSVSSRTLACALAMLLACAAFSILLIAKLREEGSRLFTLLCLCLLVLAFAHSVLIHVSWSRAVSRCLGSPSGFRYEIISDPRTTDRGFVSTAQCMDKTGDVLGFVQLQSAQSFEAGQSVTIVGRTSSLKSDEWSRSLFRKGIVCSIQVVKTMSIEEGAGSSLLRMRRQVLDRIEPARSPDRSILAALTCGRTSELVSFGLRDRCSDIGVSHLFAVSGAHLSIVTALIGAVMDHFHIRGHRASLLAQLPCLGFVLFTGASRSAIRSFLMTCFGLLAGFSDRRSHSLSSLALTAALMLTFDPRALFDLGFCFSFSSVLAISFFSRYGACFFFRCHVPRSLAASISASLFAQLATMPLAVSVFGSVSLLAPISNVALAPLVSILLSCSIVLVPVSLVLPLALIPLQWVASSCTFLIELLAGVPLSSIPVSDGGLISFVAVAALIVLYIAWPDPNPRFVGVVCGCAVACATAPVARYRYWAPPEVVVMDVGQADSILIRDGSSAILVDAGVDERASEALMRNHVFHLDAVVITHWDLDHYGGLEYLMHRCHVERVIVAEGASSHIPADVTAAVSRRIQELSFRDKLKIGSFTAAMIWPQERVSGDANDESLCLKLTYRYRDARLTVGLTGDSESAQAHEYARDMGDVDVLKLGHHGSKVSVDAEVMDRVKPELCIASAGAGNRYGHPSKECQEVVADASSRFLCTKDVGDVAISPAMKGFRVRVNHDAPRDAMLE